jgi:hypothetical protein
MGMNTLWVYGCSFSEPFGLVPGGVTTINEDKSRNLHGTDYWGTHLANKLNLKCITKSCAGVGLNYINDRIDEDIMTWDKEDYIVINPSFFSRVTFEELVKRESQSDLAPLMKDWNFIVTHNESRWRKKIQTLHYFGYKNVYTWLVDNTNHYKEVGNLITAPGDHVNWKDWMDQHYEYWQSLPGSIYPLGDWHFNEIGHVAIANRMYDFIIGNTNGN